MYYRKLIALIILLVFIREAVGYSLDLPNINQLPNDWGYINSPGEMLDNKSSYKRTYYDYGDYNSDGHRDIAIFLQSKIDPSEFGLFVLLHYDLIQTEKAQWIQLNSYSNLSVELFNYNVVTSKIEKERCQILNTNEFCDNVMKKSKADVIFQIVPFRSVEVYWWDCELKSFRSFWLSE